MRRENTGQSPAMRMITGAIAIAFGFLAIAAPAGTGEKDIFVFEVEGLVCEESGHAVEESLQSFTRITFVEVDLIEKRVTVESPAGSYKVRELLQAINAAEDSQGPMKATLKKDAAEKITKKPEK